MMSRYFRWILALLLLYPLPLVSGQQPKPQEPKPETPPVETVEEDPGAFRIGVDVNQIFLSVTARLNNGGFAKGLTRQDVRVFEDGVEQEIVNFTEEAVPVHVVLVIDASGSTRHTQASIRRAALKFAESLDEEDRVSVITFNDVPKLILNWTNDLERIEVALESIYAKGPTVLNDALYVTFDDLLRDIPGKKAVILLTDGVDTGSLVTFEEALDLAIRSEALVYVASKLDEYWAQATQQRIFLASKGVLIARELQDDYIIQSRRYLSRIAEVTGGRLMNAQAFNSLSEIYTSVAQELKNQYYISYTPSNIQRDGTWRNVEVRSRRPAVVVNTRRGYYAPVGDTPVP